jgi:hypothetical protein
MRVHKTINGDVYSFYVKLIYNKRQASVRYFQSDVEIVCDLSDDFNYILLPKNKFIFNNKVLTKLKLNKIQKIEAQDHNPDFTHQ